MLLDDVSRCTESFIVFACLFARIQAEELRLLRQVSGTHFQRRLFLGALLGAFLGALSAEAVCY
eukprot:COSAG06_NODE_6919_length_2715_cov_875.793888_2_plen_64_part_00